MKSKAVLVTYGGKTQCLREWAGELGIKKNTLYSRIVLKGWAAEEALKQPVVLGLKAKHKVLYDAWLHLKQRCTNAKDAGYANYGGRGIRVCDEWNQSFATFLEDMGGSYRKGLSLDRIDVNGNYCKENCRWATRETQANNTRANRKLCWNGVCKNLSEWAKEGGVPRTRIRDRLDRLGWSVEESLTINKSKPYGRQITSK